MEDYIKDKISKYTPPFKEEYWLAVNSELKKRRRRRLLIFWWSGALGCLVLAGLVYIIIAGDVNLKKKSFASEKQVSEIRQNTSEETQSTSTSISTSNTTSIEASNATSTSDGDVTEIMNSKTTTTGNLSENYEYKQNIAANQNADANPFDNLSSSNVEKISRTSAQSKSNTDQLSQTSIEQQGLNKSQYTDHFIEKSPESPTSTEQGISSNIEISENNDVLNENSSTALSMVISAIDLLELKFITSEPNLSTLKGIDPVQVTVSVQKFKRRPVAITLAAHALNKPVHGFVHNEEIRLQRSYTFGKRGFYLQTGIGGGRYGGELAAIDYASVSYRSFASNSQSQTLIPTSAYYINLPIEFGLHVSRWNMAFILNPEYLLGLRGKIINEEVSSLVSSETVNSVNLYEVEQSRIRTEKVRWLDQSNIRSIAIPIGLSLEYRLGEHWGIGASVLLYTHGLYRFKSPVLNHKSASGDPEQMKGGLHVKYKF